MTRSVSTIARSGSCPKSAAAARIPDDLRVAAVKASVPAVERARITYWIARPDPHASPSIPADCGASLSLAHYIEKAGTGTLEMIDQCRAHGLPEPEFREQGSQFVLTLRRDWLTPDLVARLNVSSRQVAGLAHVKAKGRITNREYQNLVGVGDRTALRDLDELVSKGALEKIGGTGRGTYYVLGRKPATNPTNAP